MSVVFLAHRSILPPAQRALWPELEPASALGFVLYGGTAVALHLGHRASEDFDFFSDRQLDETQLYRSLRFLDRSKVIQREPDTMTVLVPGEAAADRHVKVSFFGGVGFGRYSGPDVTEDGVLQVAGLDDLLATKCAVIMQRIELKDYLDIIALLEAGVSLERGLGIAAEMYGGRFSPQESLRTMTYFEGGDLKLLSAGQRTMLRGAAREIRAIPKVAATERALALPETEAAKLLRAHR